MNFLIFFVGGIGFFSMQSEVIAASLSTTVKSETQNPICGAQNETCQDHPFFCSCSNGRHGEMICSEGEGQNFDDTLPVEGLSTILDKNGKCKAEGKYFDGCNYCYCFEGRHKCTKKQCSTKGTPKLIALYVEDGHLIDSNGKCIPHREVIKVEPYNTYWCYCKDGAEICTFSCYFFSISTNPKTGLSYTENCDVEGEYRNECDVCYCEGIGFCYITDID